MLTRRELLAATGAAAAAAIIPSRALAQTPKKGGALTVRAWDPPHFDHSLVHAYKTHVAISFTHSRLLRHRAGPSVKPGSLVLEGDLAESWTQPSDTTYVFKLRKGVRFHAKPPVDGRELTAEDVRFTFERMLTQPGSNASMYRSIARIEAVDRYTVRFTLSEPFAWFLEMVASPMAGGIVARECVDKFGDLKKPEAVIGTGPWMLDSYKPNVAISLVRNPTYFIPGLPHIDRVELVVDEDNASRMAAFLAGRYDLGWEFPGTINRTDWVQIKDRLRQTRPSLQTAEYASNVVNDPMPAALTDWALPIDQLGEGARSYRHDPAEARRLLTAAGYPNGFPASVCFNSYGSTVLVDTMQLVLKHLKAVGIDARLDQKEYGAYQATCRLGKYDSLTFGPLTPFLDADNFLFGQYYTGEPRNRSHVKDPVLDDLLVRQRRAMDVKVRRGLINDIQRHLARQQYYVHAPSGTYIAVWDGALKNYGPNLGYDYGGRLVAAWLER